jgi:hypothetical protein
MFASIQVVAMTHLTACGARGQRCYRGLRVLFFGECLFHGFEEKDVTANQWLPINSLSDTRANDGR